MDHSKLSDESQSEGMNIVVKDLREDDAFSRRLTVEVGNEVMAGQMAQAIDDLRRDLALPGFRKGKVPRPVVEARFGRDLKAEVTRRVVGEALWQALREQNLHPITEPEVARIDHEEGQALTFTARVDVRPRLEPGDPASLKVNKVVRPIDDEEVERVLTNLRERLARLEPAERPAAPGDVVTIDLSELGAGQVAILGRRQADVRIELVEEAVPKIWIDALTGRRSGESAVAEVPVPEGQVAEPGAARYHRLDLKKVETKILPPLDDDFARTLAQTLVAGNEVQDLNGLRGHIRQRLEAEELRRADRAVEREILDRLGAGLKLDIPERLARPAADRLYEGAMRDYPDLDASARERVAVEAREAAAANIRRELVLAAVADAQGIEVSREEAEAEYRRLERAGRQMADPGEEASGSQRAERVERLRDVLQERKVLKYLVDTADVQVVQEAPKRKRIVTPYDP